MKLKYSGKKYGARIKNFNENAEWLKMKKLGVMGQVEEQEWNEITTAELKDALRNPQKWLSPGIDKNSKYRLNVFELIRDSITNCLNKAMTNPELNPKMIYTRREISPTKI